MAIAARLLMGPGPSNPYPDATMALAGGHRRLALICCSVELVGVLVIGTASLVDRAAFPKATVWSLYGIGYGFVPLVLPVLVELIRSPQASAEQLARALQRDGLTLRPQQTQEVVDHFQLEKKEARCR